MIHALSGEYNFDVITALLGHAEPEIAIPAEDSISVVVPGLGASRPVIEVDLEAVQRERVQQYDLVHENTLEFFGKRHRQYGRAAILVHARAEPFRKFGPEPLGLGLPGVELFADRALKTQHRQTAQVPDQPAGPLDRGDPHGAEIVTLVRTPRQLFVQHGQMMAFRSDVSSRRSRPAIHARCLEAECYV